ncbi:MAG TPA: hypothetical protein VFT56_04990 [Sphingomonas sp.]|nr:hypothetical protein [Sphingomonas sp.]
MNRAAADDRASASAGAQFCQGHPHRHDVSSSLLATNRQVTNGRRNISPVVHKAETRNEVQARLPTVAAAIVDFQDNPARIHG